MFKKFLRAYGDPIWINMDLVETVEKANDISFSERTGAGVFEERSVPGSTIKMSPSGRELTVRGTPEEVTDSRAPSDGEAA